MAMAKGSWRIQYTPRIPTMASRAMLFLPKVLLSVPCPLGHQHMVY